MSRANKILTIVLVISIFFTYLSATSVYASRERNSDLCLDVETGVACIYYVKNTPDLEVVEDNTPTPTEIATESFTSTPEVTETESATQTPTMTVVPSITQSVTSTQIPNQNGVTYNRGRYAIGTYEPEIETSVKWDEFFSTSENPNFILGENGTERIRKWIGHSNCGTCNPGITKSQSFEFHNLIEGKTYLLALLPANVIGTSQYSVSISGGTISSGATKTWSSGYKKNKDAWNIFFSPTNQETTIAIGNWQTSGSNYLYFDTIHFIDPSVQNIYDFESEIMSMDGDWWRNNLWDSSGRYNWREGYVIDSYLDMYEMTKNVYWLDRVITHADSVLLQRNNGPVWRELLSGYTWIGFSGSITMGMARFAHVVERDNLSQYQNKAIEYATATRDAIDFFDQYWIENGTEGWWTYGSDNPTLGLRNKEAAYDMQSLLATSSLWLSQYNGLGETARLDMLEKATKYATHFKSILTITNNRYIWKFSTYYDYVQDVGHGNYDVLFAQRAYEQGIVFTESDMQKFGKTLEGFLVSNGDVPENLINGTESIDGVSNSIRYWAYMGEYNAYASLKLVGRSDYDFIGLILDMRMRTRP